MNVTLRFAIAWLFCLLSLSASAQTNPVFYGTVTFNNTVFAGSARFPATMLGLGVPSTLTFLRGDGRWMPISTVSVSSVNGTANEIDANSAAGAVTLSLPTSLVFTGKTVTGGTFSSGTYSGVFVGNINGIATSANVLATPRNINGVAFDGSANITVTAAANTLSGSALAAGVTSAPGLLSASIGTLQSMATQSYTNIAVTGGNMTGVAVTGLPTPSLSTDAATKGYVDSIGTGIVPRTQVRVASTANIAALSGLLTVDGVTVIAGDRVLVKDNTTTAQNGIYDAAAGAWARSSDSDTVGELLFGYYYLVTAGSTQTGTSWFIQTAPATINVSPILFGKFSQPQSYSNGTGLNLVGTVFSVAATQNFTSIGAITPGTGAFTTLGATGLITGFGLNLTSGGTSISSVNANSTQNIGNIGNVNGTVAWGVAADGHGYIGTSTNNNFNIRMNGSEIGLFTATGMNATQIGQTTPSVGAFTTLNSTGGALNGTLGVNTPGTVAATTITTTGAISQGTALGEKLLTFVNGNDKYGLGMTGGALKIFASQGHALSFGTVSLVDGVTFTQSASIDATGLNNTAIGAITPAAATFTTIASNSNANIRTTKSNFHEILNVKDYGAVGDGVTNDATAINSAIAAMTNYSTLFFPSGRYRITAGLSAFASLTAIRVTGDKAEIFNDTGSSGGNTLVFNSTCSTVEVDGLSFTGSSTVRGSGIHIRMYCSYAKIHDNYFSGCSDFAIHLSNSGAAYSASAEVCNNMITGPLGDGIHVGNYTNVLITGNLISATGDDGIACIADDPAFPPYDISIIGNKVLSAGGAASSVSGVGIRIEEASDILVASNAIKSPWENAIEVGRYSSTTAYNARVHIVGNKIYNSTTHAGPRGAIWMQFCAESSIEGNIIYDTANGAAICLLDFNDVAVRGNTIRGTPTRSIVCDDSTTTNVAANWYGLTVDSNVIQYNVSNEAIYIVPAVGKLINNVLITSNVGNQLPAGDWIYCARVATGKITNNTSRDGKSVTTGGLTAVNNN